MKHHPNAVEQIRRAKPAKPHKYHRGSKEDRTYNGVTYDSVLERQVAQWLDVRLREPCVWCNSTGQIYKSGKNYPCPDCRSSGYTGGDVLSWERQVEYNLEALKGDWPIELKATNIAELIEPGQKYELGEKVGTYVIDFVVYFADGTTAYWECKALWPGRKRKRKCKTCNGTGRVDYFATHGSQDGTQEPIVSDTECINCNGSGEIITRGKPFVKYVGDAKLKIAIWKANNPKLAENFRIITQKDIPDGF